MQNLLLTYLIAATAYRLLRVKKDWVRLAFASMLGCAAALFYPFFSLPALWGVVLKLLLGIALAAVLFAGKRCYGKGLLALYAATFLFGGAVFALGCLRYKNAVAAMQKPLKMHWWVSVAAAVALYNALRGGITAYHRRADTNLRVYRYRCVLAGKEIEGNAFMDTGNRLYDGKTGLPVVVLGVKTLLPYLSDEQAAQLLTGHCERVFRGAHRIACGSAVGAGGLWVVAPERFEVYSQKSGNILLDVMVGLSFTALGGAEGYDALLHPAICEVAHI